MVFLPPEAKTHKRMLHCYCQWCATVQTTRGAYKLRDGPVDWYFCNDMHALEWLDNRHKTPGINAMLRKTPTERRAALGKLSIDEYCTRELSHRQSRLDEIAANRVGSDGVRDLHCSDVSM